MTRFSIPKGAKWDPKTGNWFIPFTVPTNTITSEISWSDEGELRVQGFEVAGQPTALDKNERGAIIVDPIEGSTDAQLNSHFRESVVLDPGLVKAGLLLFDRLEYLDWDRVAPSPFRNIERVELAGVTQRREVGPTRGYATDFRDIYQYVWQANDETAVGAWSLWGSIGSLHLPKTNSGGGLALKLKLQDALLIPHVSVEAETVLAFKARRRDELANLRHHVEAICVAMSRGGADPVEARIATEKLEQSVRDYLKAIREENWMKSVLSLDVHMDLAEAARTAVAGGLLTTIGTAFATGNFGTTLATLLGGGAAGLTLELARGNKKPAEQPFAYLGEIRRVFQ